MSTCMLETPNCETVHGKGQGDELGGDIGIER